MPLLSAGQLMQTAQQQALNGVFLKTQTPAVAATYMAISTAAASGVLNSTEVLMSGATINEYATATGYARQSYGPVTATAASPSVIYNTALMTWGPFTSAPGTANWGVCCDLASGGTAKPIAAFLLASPRTPAIGDSLQAAAGTGSAGVGFLCQV
jgi:hypothetical protein